jgi:hypothetical protein
MIGLLVVRQRVPPGRIIGARGPATREAHDESDPGVRAGLAFMAASRLGVDRQEVISVLASRCRSVQAYRARTRGLVMRIRIHWPTGLSVEHRCVLRVTWSQARLHGGGNAPYEHGWSRFLITGPRAGRVKIATPRSPGTGLADSQLTARELSRPSSFRLSNRASAAPLPGPYQRYRPHQNRGQLHSSGPAGGTLAGPGVCYSKNAGELSRSTRKQLGDGLLGPSGFWPPDPKKT